MHNATLDPAGRGRGAVCMWGMRIATRPPDVGSFDAVCMLRRPPEPAPAPTSALPQVPAVLAIPRSIWRGLLEVVYKSRLPHILYRFSRVWRSERSSRGLDAVGSRLPTIELADQPKECT
jgi:hypothetical protein